MVLWILVADQVRARLFAQRVKQGVLTELESFVNLEGRAHNRDLETDRPPRVNESVGSARHAIEPHTSPKDKIAERFARQISEVLEKGRVDHQYDQFVLIASPKFLGILHSLLNKHLHEKIAAQVTLDLTTATPEEIRSHLPESLSFLGTKST